MLGAARAIDRVNKIALDFPPSVSTVGLVQVSPNSRNTIPGTVFFTVDLRHPDDDRLLTMKARLDAALTETCGALGLVFENKEIWWSPAVRYDEGCIDAVRQAASEMGYSHRDIVSGAGHDAGYIARVAPVGMVFVPCKDGISHNEIEDASPDDLAAGCNVLMRAMLAQAAGE
jgi:beta-ureidopropionase / N-carbamoyl-L-amino-acid hydrolase